MAYADKFLRLVASGSLHSGTETFSFSFAFMRRTPGSTPAVPTEVPPAIVTAFQTYWGVNGVISSQALLRSIKLNEIGTDGRYVNDDTVEHEFTGTPPAGPSLPNYPPQIALAVSLRTDAARGRAHAGRFYIPSPSAAMQTGTGTISGSAQSTVSQASKELLDACNAALVGWRVAVVSKVGSGAQRPVLEVAVGAALDTIRSRRTDLAEAYVTRALTEV